MILPHRIMSCHDYRLPKLAYYDWENIRGTIRLRGPIDRRIVMDLNYGDFPNGEQAVRVSVEDADVNYQPSSLPELRPLAADVPKDG